MVKKLFSGLTTLGALGFLVYQMFFAYGSKVSFGGGEEVYYKGGATEAEAQMVGAELQRIEFFDGVGDASVQLVKRDEDLIVRFVTIDSAWTDPEMQDTFGRIGWDLSQKALSGKNVIVELCDSSLKTKATVTMKENRVDESQKVSFGEKEAVYYRGAATEDEAKRLGESLKTLGFFNGTSEAAAQVDKEGDKTIVRLVTIESAWNDAELEKEFARAGWTISQEVFSGKPVTVELCDSWLETKASIEMKEPSGE